MPEHWFTSDQHFGHANIIKHCNRPFSDVDEMNIALIQNWNAHIKPNDYVYMLGDFAYWKLEQITIERIFDQLNGKKHLIFGNHDNIKILEKLNWVWIKDTCMITIHTQNIWLSHYAHRSWPRSYQGSWHLFGHSHGNIYPHNLSFDVGVDCWDFCLVHFDQIAKTMNQLNEKLKETRSQKIPYTQKRMLWGPEVIEFESNHHRRE